MILSAPRRARPFPSTSDVLTGDDRKEIRGPLPAGLPTNCSLGEWPRHGLAKEGTGMRQRPTLRDIGVALVKLTPALRPPAEWLYRRLPNWLHDTPTSWLETRLGNKD